MHICPPDNKIFCSKIIIQHYNWSLFSVKSLAPAEQSLLLGHLQVPPNTALNEAAVCLVHYGDQCFVKKNQEKLKPQALPDLPVSLIRF